MNPALSIKHMYYEHIRAPCLALGPIEMMNRKNIGIAVELRYNDRTHWGPVPYEICYSLYS